VYQTATSAEQQFDTQIHGACTAHAFHTAVTTHGSTDIQKVAYSSMQTALLCGIHFPNHFTFEKDAPDL
jgi:hypothetical protein